MSALRLSLFACARTCLRVCLNIFTSFVLFFFPLPCHFHITQGWGEKRFMSFFHNLIRSYTQEGRCSMDLPDHVNEVPWLCSH